MNRYTQAEKEQLSALAEQPLTASAVSPEDQELMLSAVADWRSELQPEKSSAGCVALTGFTAG